jgi:hypothetical protein
MASADGTSNASATPRGPAPRVGFAAGAVLVLAAVAIAAGAGTATAQATTAPLKASLRLSAAHTVLGQRLHATLSKSHAPRGRATAITLSWGDHTRPVKLRSLVAHPTHRYPRPGRYRATLTLRSGKAISRSSAIEVVRAVGGRYAGSNGQNGNGMSFYVSGDGTHIQDVYDSAAGSSCTGGGGLVQPFGIPEAVIGASAGFATTVTEHAIVGGQAATITRVFSGHLTGRNASGVPQASGTWRDTVALSSGTVCTSNTVAWSAVRDAQPPQTQTRPPDGTYTGANGQNGNGLSFHVAGGVVQNVSDLAVGTDCLGGGGVISELTLASIPINANGSFAGSATEDGVLAGRAVTFTRTFRGNFHAVSSAGVPRGAGTWREDIAFHDTGQTCTSSDQTWSTERTGG